LLAALAGRIYDHTPQPQNAFPLGSKRTTMEASRLRMTLLLAQLWAFRILAVLCLVFLCVLAGSGIPALAFALAWGPNGLFLVWFMRGTLHLPRFLVPVQPLEPVLYRWVGVGFVKRIVATRMWPLVNGMEPPPAPRNPRELLDRIELTTRGAEVCHGATFLSVLLVAVSLLAVGQFPEAVWILGFNVLLNGYPVMLQRVNRWRVQQLRTSALQET
jgi:hypothetical protein